MTTVTNADIERIINGEPIEIDAKYPLDDKTQWFMRQPPDWLADMADVARQAAIDKVMAMPEIEDLKAMPPTEDWIANQERLIAENKARIAELEANPSRTAEEDLELALNKDLDVRYYRPENYSRAMQRARSAGQRAYDNYLLPRLVVDAKGKMLFDTNTKDGAGRWNRLKDKDKESLSGAFAYLQLLESLAKNSNGGQSSS